MSKFFSAIKSIFSDSDERIKEEQYRDWFVFPIFLFLSFFDASQHATPHDRIRTMDMISSKLPGLVQTLKTSSDAVSKSVSIQRVADDLADLRVMASSGVVPNEALVHAAKERLLKLWMQVLSAVQCVRVEDLPTTLFTDWFERIIDRPEFLSWVKPSLVFPAHPVPQSSSTSAPPSSNSSSSNTGSGAGPVLSASTGAATARRSSSSEQTTPTLSRRSSAEAATAAAAAAQAMIESERKFLAAYRQLLTQTYLFIAGVLATHEGISTQESASTHTSPLLSPDTKPEDPDTDVSDCGIAPATEPSATSGTEPGDSAAAPAPAPAEVIIEPGYEHTDSAPSSDSTMQPPSPHPTLLPPSLGSAPGAADVTVPTLEAAPAMSGAFVAFAAKFLSLAYWRVPVLQRDMCRYVYDSKRSRLPAPERDLHRDKQPYTEKDYPELFGWATLLAAPAEGESTGGEDTEESVHKRSKKWLVRQMTRHTEFFLVFLCEWLNGVYAVVGERFDGSVQWARLPGYAELAKSFLQYVMELPVGCAWDRTRSRAEITLLLTSPAYVLNGLLRFAFQRTPLGSVDAVLATLMDVEGWLSILVQHGVVLTDDFDADRLCDALDLILRLDHFNLTAKLLAMLYDYGDVFAGAARIKVFGELLLEKHFYRLFCHWDDNVRSIYCQILAFRMLQTRRKFLTPTYAEKRQRRVNKAVAFEHNSRQSVDTIILAKIEALTRSAALYVQEQQQQQQQQQQNAAATGATSGKTATTRSPRGSSERQLSRSLRSLRQSRGSSSSSLLSLSSPAGVAPAAAPSEPHPISAAVSAAKGTPKKTYTVDDGLLPPCLGACNADADADATTAPNTLTPVPPKLPLTAADYSALVPAYLRTYIARGVEEYNHQMRLYQEWQSQSSTQHAPPLTTAF